VATRPLRSTSGRTGSNTKLRIMIDVGPRLATAPLAAAGLIAGYAVAVATGSRTLGGLVLAGCGLVCIAAWLRRDGRRTATLLTIAGLAAFALSHAIGLIIGPWPAVLLAAASIGVLTWHVSDSRRANLT
jgi:prepilin signal peptidase PulO-like enzyme (type II secretory pathway)